MDTTSTTEDLLGLHVCMAQRSALIGPAIGCEALASPIGTEAGSGVMWKPAWLDLDKGIVRLRDGHDHLGIVNHEFTSGTRIYLRFPGRQYDLKLREANRLSDPALAHVKRCLRRSVPVAPGHA
ncbi:hypothetical protein [Paraburkholderia youngii]|uniref:hypothetical protein n=1 Tax=Paraburkholderia youngii TaxID=2782701 RepID=UPI003D1CCE79